MPGCIATGKTQKEARKNMQEALEFHLEGLKLKDVALSHLVNDALVKAYA